MRSRRLAHSLGTVLCCTTALLLTLSPLTALPSSAAASRSPAPAPGRVTILYDAFGDKSGLTPDWGFAALIEYGGRRILFDTGNDGEIFAHNVRALGVDLKKLDFVVISHRHGDHVAGLGYVLQVNPHVKIYAPKENFGAFGSELPGTFFRRDSTLPPRMRYFNGTPAARLRFGTAWPKANFIWIDSLTEVAPGVDIISTVSQNPGTLELRELSLAIRTPDGVLLIVGCSHPGIENIVRESLRLDDRVRVIFGGLHLVNTQDQEIDRIATALHDQMHVEHIAPGHCTGEPAFATLQRVFGTQYMYAGLGTATELR
jgi:7,8-dihydropterin-6-yl-methyl-4-(beta-D-ribofuranosyl)aminobenzene 5'-phosphate synthase